MLDDGAADAEHCFGFREDARHLALCHLFVCGILNSSDGPSPIFGAHCSDEHSGRATFGGSYFLRQRLNVDRVLDDCCSFHPPATGGITATSSPSKTMVR